MGTLADSLFTVLMSWVRALVNALWALFSADHTTVLEFLGKHWLMIAAVLIAAGLVIDWIIWLLRWQPYHLWAQRARRLLRIESGEDEEEEEELRAHAAVTRGHSYARPAQEDEMEDEADGLFPPPPFESDMSEEDERAVMQQADSVPDEELGAYPGMRYDSPAAGSEAMAGTQRYSAVQVQGPGAAEVERRRAEIDAWQLQMQEEARARAEAERAAREAEQARLAQEAYEAEQARLAQEAYEAEQARLAQEAYEAEQARLAQEAYEAEQARLAQEEYERQLAEYERQKAQYERDLAEYERQKAQYALDLAEYERQKAEYEAALARQAAMQETAQELEPQAEYEQETAAPAARRRRSAKKSYSDYVSGESVDALPDAPKWPQMEEDLRSQPQEKPAKHHKLLDQMAKIIEPEEEQLSSIKKLPPRVNMQDAYKPAAAPRKPGRRSRKD